MASPKSGKLCTLVPPAGPKKPHAADEASPGEVEEIKAEQRKLQAGKYGEAKVKPFGAGEEGEEEKKNWIAIELTDEEGNPVPGEYYEVILADYAKVTGTLDDKGTARVDGIDPGQAEVTFPNLDKEAWQNK